MIEVIANTPILYIIAIFFTAIVVYIFSLFATQSKTFEQVIEEQKKNSNDIFLFSNSSNDKGKSKKTKKVVPKTRVKPKPLVKEENGLVKEPVVSGVPSKLPLTESSPDMDSEAPKSKKRKTVGTSKAVGKLGSHEGEIQITQPLTDVSKKSSKKDGGSTQEKEYVISAGKVAEQKEAVELSNDGKVKISNDSTDKPAGKKETEEKVNQKIEKKNGNQIEQDTAAKEQQIIPKEKISSAPKEKREVSSIPKEKREPVLKEKIEAVSVPKEKREPTEKTEVEVANVKESSVEPPVSKEKAIHHSTEVAEIKEGKTDALSPIKKSKKSKSHTPNGYGEKEGVSASHLLTLIGKALLTEEEVQLLIDQLLNLKGEAATWTKKNDPVATLKKQLAEREAQLEVETQKGAGATQKLRDLRQEYNQEKTRWVQLERQNREQAAQLTAQLRSAQNSAQKASEDYTALQAKVQAHNKEVEEYAASKKTLQEEITQLKKTISDMEAEHKEKESKLELETSAQLESASSQASELSSTLSSCEAQLHLHKQMLEENRTTVSQQETLLQEKETQICSLYDKITALNAHTEQDQRNIQELQSKLASVQQDDRLARALHELKVAKEVLQQKEVDHQQFLCSLFPNIPPQENFGEGIRQHCQALHADCERLTSCVASLENQVEHYKATLVNAESLLKRLQSNVEDEEARWKQTLALHQQDLQQVTQERNCLLQDKEELRRELSAEKSNVSSLSSEVEARLGQLQREKEMLTQELENLQAKLDKETKLNKELALQINKHTGLVQQCQEALKCEQAMVMELSSKLQAKLPAPSPPELQTTSNGQESC